MYIYNNSIIVQHVPYINSQLPYRMHVFTDSKLRYGKVFHNFNMLINKTLFSHLLCLFDGIPYSCFFLVRNFVAAERRAHLSSHKPLNYT